MNNFLEKVIKSPGFGDENMSLAARSTERQTIDITMSEVAVDTATVSRGVKCVNGAVDFAIVEIKMKAGSTELTFVNGETRWLISPKHFDSAKRGQQARIYEAFTPPLLNVLDDIHTEIPWQHFAHRSLSALKLEEVRVIEDIVPAAFSLPQRVQDSFGDCILELAREITLAKKWDRTHVNEVASAARLKKQFDRIPAGTILVSRSYTNSIAIVSDAPGSRTKRSLTIHRTGQQEYQLDMGKVRRNSYCFLTPQKATQLDPGLLSQHQVFLSLRQAKDLVSDFPDLAADA